MQYFIEKVERKDEDSSLLEEMTFKDVEWLVFIPEERKLKGTPPVDYMDNILVLYLNVSDGYGSITSEL